MCEPRNSRIERVYAAFFRVVFQYFIARLQDHQLPYAARPEAISSLMDKPVQTTTITDKKSEGMKKYCKAHPPRNLAMASKDKIRQRAWGGRDILWFGEARSAY